MKTIHYCAAMILALAAPGLKAQSAGQTAQGDSTSHDGLYRTISELDTEFFGAFNNCVAPQQLQKHADFMDPNVEFYHDNGGVS